MRRKGEAYKPIDEEITLAAYGLHEIQLRGVYLWSTGYSSKKLWHKINL